MRHIELHVIQSFPVACLNRDDLNSPKTAVFGGIQRARVSSQSWKRAIREYAKELAPEAFQGERTRLLYDPLFMALKKNDLSDKLADEGARSIADELAKIDDKSKEQVKVSTLYFMSPLEIETLAKAYLETKNAKKAINKVSKEIGAGVIKDAADIALFGRMVASDHSLTIEGAANFAHALSTHKVDNEIDFFTAIDDRQSQDEAGAGMAGTLEFNSATYYRFVSINLDMLKDEKHLGALSKKERQEVLRSFIEAAIKAVPQARKNSMNANTLPNYVLGIVREKGHPVQLVNAFEKAVRPTPKKSLVEVSVEALQEEKGRLKEIWGLEPSFEQAVPDVSFNDFLNGVVSHVV